MTTGWLIVNIALIAVVTAIVTIPAVLIPNILHRQAILENRETRLEGREAQLERAQRSPAQRERVSARRPVSNHGQPADGQRRQVA